MVIIFNFSYILGKKKTKYSFLFVNMMDCLDPCPVNILANRHVWVLPVCRPSSPVLLMTKRTIKNTVLVTV